MREMRTSGSEGGRNESNRFSLPLSAADRTASRADRWAAVSLLDRSVVSSCRRAVVLTRVSAWLRRQRDGERRRT